MKTYKFAEELKDREDFTITAIYENESKAGNKYVSFYVKGDDDIIYTTRWMGLSKWKTPVKAKMTPTVKGDKVFYNFKFLVD